jgi:bifunctional oligoribonuclease and PAP phosphatase NrnA
LATGKAFFQELEELKELLSGPRKIVITTHHKPDADALGSSLAMWGYLKKKGHDVVVITPTDYPVFLKWMNGEKEVIIYEEDKQKISERLVYDADLIFCLDFSVLSRINELGEVIKNAPGKKILVDHHLEPENFADLSFSDVSAAATCVLVYKIIVGMGDRLYLDTCIGECIYAGIMTDTGSFRHPSTNKEVHLIIAELINLAVDISTIHRLIYDNNSEKKLRFLGHTLLNKLEILKELRTSFISVSANELSSYDSQTGDTEGLVNFALSVENVVFAAVIIEREDGVKISFRSKGDFSVSEFARKHFFGGGHKNAAGGKSDLPLAETIEYFKEIVLQYKEELQTIKLTDRSSC